MTYVIAGDPNRALALFLHALSGAPTAFDGVPVKALTIRKDGALVIEVDG